MSFDIPTVLALCTFSALLSAVVLGTANARDPFPGVREAIFAMLTLATGFVLQLLRDRLATALIIVTSNILFWVAAVFIHRACRRFEGQRPQPRWPLVVVGAGVMLFAGYISYGAPYGVRAITSSMILAVLFVPALHELARESGLRKEPSRWLMFALVLVTTVSLLLRVIILAPHYAQEAHILTPALERTLAFVPSLIFAQGFGLALVIMNLERSANLARELAMSDALTGCLNRRALEAQAHTELAHAARHRRPCALVIVDLDHFKKINDVHGHAAGDAALAYTGALLRGAVRPGDVVARYGGEEFCVLLRDADVEQATRAAERLREQVHASKVETTGGELALSASLGVAVFAPDAGESWDALFHRADEALYRSKREGRNRVSTAPPPAPLAGAQASA